MSFYKIAYHRIGLRGMWWYIYYLCKENFLSLVSQEHSSARELILYDFMLKSIEDRKH